jgi:hypothetical protein
MVALADAPNQQNWIYNEDAALKLKLQGLTVSDANNPARPVPVRYRLPEDELATLTYPIVIIEHLPMSFARERAHRNFLKLNYAPDGFPIWWDPAKNTFDPNESPYMSEFPLPVNLDYKVTIYCRKMVEHLQPLIAQLALQPYLPFQFGFLDVPQDGTIRNMFLMEGPETEYGKDQDNKRLFRCSYMVRVMSEVIPEVFVNGLFNGIVKQINLDLGCYADVTDLTTELVAANQAIISTGPNLAFNVGINPVNGPPGHTEPLATRPIPRRESTRVVER